MSDNQYRFNDFIWRFSSTCRFNAFFNFSAFFIFPVCRPTAPDGAKITMTKCAIDFIFPLCRLRGGKMLFLFKITKINFSAFLCVSGLMPFSNVVDWISSVCVFSLLFLLISILIIFAISRRNVAALLRSIPAACFAWGETYLFLCCEDNW